MATIRRAGPCPSSATRSTILIDGRPAADARVGNCSVLKFDPARARGGETIEFSGPLDIVTVVETKAYLHAKG
jgi:hypothetical protein